ncbi:MAG: Jag N-terminal domain-containing protein [Ardenticatenaceae bacterium]|nr:Jag N-terminal domain-containing protein [Ardenticatenaceae bacterium]
MSTVKKEIEARGSNVEAAIRNGLERLRVQREDVVVEVVDEGSRGLLGLGSRDAVVRLKVITYLTPEPPAPKPEPKPVAPPPKPVVQPKPAAPPPTQTAVPPQPPAPPKPEPVVVPVPQPPVAPPAPVEEAQVEEAAEAGNEGETAVSIITQLLTMMDFSDVTVSAKLSEEDDLTGERIDVVQVEGQDLGVLIGSRGETLDSLQYVARLMVSHKLRERANFVVDVQQYRERRQLALTRMAERMAQKAIQRNKPVILEPMPAHERRIIHMVLRNSDKVYTNSVGEGDRRRVKIFPK